MKYPSSVRRVVLWGCAGSGKTQLALKYAHEHSIACGPVFWVSASNRETLQKSFAKLRFYLGLPEGMEADLNNNTALQQKAIALVLAWFAQTEEVNWLLVIDNADEPQRD
jgi:GTPase SAR1 family protein